VASRGVRNATQPQSAGTTDKYLTAMLLTPAGQLSHKTGQRWGDANECATTESSMEVPQSSR
jgi:hypothetical protein